MKKIIFISCAILILSIANSSGSEFRDKVMGIKKAFIIINCVNNNTKQKLSFGLNDIDEKIGKFKLVHKIIDNNTTPAHAIVFQDIDSALYWYDLDNDDVNLYAIPKKRTINNKFKLLFLSMTLKDNDFDDQLFKRQIERNRRLRKSFIEEKGGIDKFVDTDVRMHIVYINGESMQTQEYRRKIDDTDQYPEKKEIFECKQEAITF